jgi:hypothetical protein
MSVHTPDDLAVIAESLEVPVCLIEYLYEEYLEIEEEEPSFQVYIADRIADSVFTANLYYSGDVDQADEESANVFSEVCELLGVTLEV